MSPEEKEIPIVRWRCCFKYGYAQPTVTGAWKHVCKGSITLRGGVERFHPYDAKCRVRGHDKAGHGPITSTASRDMVAMYGGQLTRGSEHLTIATKRELWKLRHNLSANGGVPAEWGQL